MGVLVLRQIACSHGISQRKSLPERQTQPFSSDGIHAAGSVANQSDIVSLYATQRAHGADGAAFPAAQRCAKKSFSQGWHLIERRFK